MSVLVCDDPPVVRLPQADGETQPVVGVAIEGAGPLLAVGSGTVRVTSEPGWPGTAFIALQLDQGPLAGRIICWALPVGYSRD